MASRRARFGCAALTLAAIGCSAATDTTNRSVMHEPCVANCAAAASGTAAVSGSGNLLNSAAGIGLATGAAGSSSIAPPPQAGTFSGTPGAAGMVGSNRPPVVGGVPAAIGTAGMASTPPAGAAGAPVDTGPPLDPSKGCEGETMPAVTGDYSANGPLPTKIVDSTGPDGMYTVYRPATLGANGFKHPVATWGNGITTDPSFYPGLLGAVASHGFVVIASNSSSVTTDLMIKGLDWMLAQNSAAGDYQGKLNPTCLVTFGYSLGGGASVGAGAHANVVATSSMHGVTGPANALHAPLLLLTSQTDTFVTPDGFVTPTFTASTVQTFYGTLTTAGDPGNQGHLIPVDGALSLITSGGANMAERAAVIAWLRLWVYSDQGAKKYFYGDDCILCKAPWLTPPQRKNWK
jgi:hypothetical protein